MSFVPVYEYLNILGIELCKGLLVFYLNDMLVL